MEDQVSVQADGIYSGSGAVLVVFSVIVAQKVVIFKYSDYI